MAHDASQNNPKKEVATALIGIVLLLAIILGIGVSAFLRPAGEHQPKASEVASEVQTATAQSGETASEQPADSATAPSADTATATAESTDTATATASSTETTTATAESTEATAEQPAGETTPADGTTEQKTDGQ